MPVTVNVKGKPEVASAGIACSQVCRRPGGGFAATVELKLELVLPDGTVFRGGSKHVYV